YWAWDPVENGSLIPWLIGTAFVHTLMAWQYSGMLKKSSIALAIAGFAMCNFATFLTRSGIFSSLHAFSQSPIGWLFLGLMLVICVGGTILILRHRHALGTDRRVKNFWTRESLIVVSTITLVTLAAVTLAGTLSVALSDAIVGRRIIVGPPFYNHVLIPVALVLLATMAAAPLFRWSAEPSPKQKRAFKYSAAVASVSLMVVWFFGVRHPLGWVIGWLASFSIATHSACLALELWQRNDRQPWTALGTTLRLNRKLYAGFLIHIGFISIAVGLTGSSLGTRREELVMKQGQIVQWAGRTIQFRQLIERDLGDKYVVEAELIVSRGEADAYRLLPAQHLHRLQDQWTTEVDIHSTWRGDFYTILHYGEGDDEVRLTLVENPLMRWIWFGALVIVAATTLRLFPSRQFQNQPRIATQLIQRSGIRGKRRALETVGT
ncbi:MAG: cytochrome c biogenesis protein CcsA, partial [Planctomycetales bacterium]|nr:cytochrome c biogenesis protein CcsA [Planctomycetales bacterium]